MDIDTHTGTEAKKAIAADSERDCYFKYMSDLVRAQKKWLECERMAREERKDDQS
jgi:hypothetical protein